MMQQFGQGQQTLFDNGSQINTLEFIFNRLLARTSTVKVVKVVGVSPGEGSTPGTVDVKPLVMQIDGQGNASSHGTIYKFPYARVQAGGSAIIVDPVVGDIGVCVVSDRDISAVKVNKAESPPGSFRQFDWADGIYMFSILSSTEPVVFLKLTPDGVVIQDNAGNKMEFKPGSIDVTTSAFRVNGLVIAGFGTGDQVSLQTHNHPTAAPGPPSSPTPGS